MYEILKLLHLIGASIWLGGMILIGALMPALRANGGTDIQVKSLAQRFGSVGWGAYFLALVTGFGMFFYAWSMDTLNIFFHLKMTFIIVAGGLTFLHSKAGDLSAKNKGMIQGMILLSTIGIFYSAIQFTS